MKILDDSNIVINQSFSITYSFFNTAEVPLREIKLEKPLLENKIFRVVAYNSEPFDLYP